MRNALFLLLLFLACGTDPAPAGGYNDAAVRLADAAAVVPLMDGGLPALCNDYCQEEEFHCDGVNSFFPDRASCEAYCGTLAIGMPGDQTGDTLNCRAHWVDQPSAAEPATNCPKAAPNSPVCD